MQHWAGCDVENVLFVLMFVVLLASKLALISKFAGYTPFWDQWDAEAVLLYKPYLDGHLSLKDLFSAHNEHRIFFTRLQALVLLELRGAWDTKLQMIANSVLQATAMVFLIALLNKGLDKHERLLLLIFTCIVMILPLGWENTLAGFQSQFHFVALFSWIGISFAYRAIAFDRAWWIALALALMSFLSSASGSLTLLLFAGLFTLQVLSGVRRGWLEIVSIFTILMTFAFAYTLVPHIAVHDSLKAQDLAQFLIAASYVFGWPLSPLPVAILMVNLPALAFGLYMLRNPPEHSDWRWLMLGLIGWTALQLVSLAYGRAAAPLASRYLDTIATSLVINAAVGLWLLSLYRAKWRHGLATVIAAVWAAAIFFSLANWLGEAFAGASHRGRIAAVHAQTVTTYLTTGNAVVLEVPQGISASEVIPYPSSDRLREALDNATIRSIIPDPLNPSFDRSEAVRRLILRGVFSTITVGSKRGLLALSWPIFIGGVALLMLVVAYAFVVRAGPSARESDKATPSAGPVG